MNSARFAPFRELDDRLASWMPAVDIEETDREYLVRADLPDVNRHDVKVSIADGVLSVEGERRQETEATSMRLIRVERSYGRFIRRLTVPNDVDAAKIAADFKNGVLNVHLPKWDSAPARVDA